MIILAYILSGLSFVMSALLPVQTTSPKGWLVLIFKLAAGALSPCWAILGAAGAVLGWVSQAFWAVPIGMVGAGMMILYVWRSSRNHKGFEEAYGAGWSEEIPPAQAEHMVQKRWKPYLKMKASPEPKWERDIAFWTIPDSDRELLCDVWSPADGNVSGLAYIYLHGSGWWVMDKDFGTRPYFRHLVAQGHTVMDVAYRLCPEVDLYGMVGDAKRAVAWIKANASRYGVDPEKIVLGGGSAGCHLALLAAYTPDHPDLTPADVKHADLSVSGVISFYGPTDLLATYEYENQQVFVASPPVPIGPDTPRNKADFGRMDVLLGGHPQDVPHMYELASPITHVHSGSPPTLLIQGEQDFLVPIESVRALHAKLVQSGVPAINLVYPWTDHGFDLLLPQVNPAAQSAIYDVDRFLALSANGVRRN